MSGVFERFGRKCYKEGYNEGYNKAYSKGYAESYTKVRTEERLRLIKAFMRNCGLTRERALEILEIPLKDREILMSQL